MKIRHFLKEGKNEIKKEGRDGGASGETRPPPTLTAFSFSAVFSFHLLFHLALLLLLLFFPCLHPSSPAYLICVHLFPDQSCHRTTNYLIRLHPALTPPLSLFLSSVTAPPSPAAPPFPLPPPLCHQPIISSPSSPLHPLPPRFLPYSG